MVSGKVRRALKKLRKMTKPVTRSNYAKESAMCSEINGLIHHWYDTENFKKLKLLFEILKMDDKEIELPESRFIVMKELDKYLGNKFEEKIWDPCREKGVIDSSKRYFEK